MTTTKQTAANCRNSEDSTGPTSKAGKRRSRSNPWKHGLTAREVLLPEEKDEAFEATLRRLYKECQPEGILECLEVERIVSLSCRLRRIPRIEMESLDYLRRRSSLGRARQLFEKMKADAAGEMAEDCFSAASSWLAATDRVLRAGPEGKTPPDPDDPEVKELVVQLLRDNVTIKGECAKVAGILDLKEIEHLCAAPTLGEAFLAGAEGADVLDRLSRYESYLLRQLQKALQRLEDLQTKRVAQAG